VALLAKIRLPLPLSGPLITSELPPVAFVKFCQVWSALTLTAAVIVWAPEPVATAMPPEPIVRVPPVPPPTVTEPVAVTLKVSLLIETSPSRVVDRLPAPLT